MQSSIQFACYKTYHMCRDFETPVTPFPCCYMLNATMPCPLVIIIMLMLSIMFAIYTSVRSSNTTLFLGGEVDLVLRCVSRGFGTAAVTSAYYEYISYCLLPPFDRRHTRRSAKTGKDTTYLCRESHSCTSHRCWCSL